MPRELHLPPRQTPPEAPAPAPGFFERIGGIRGLAGMGIRGLAGVLGAEGGLPGAAIAGLGETAAQTVEPGSYNPTRVAAEAGLGTIPFSAVTKFGRPLASMLRGALLGGGGTAVRELSSGGIEALNPKDIAIGAGIGGATSGIVSKFLGPKIAPQAKAPAFEIEPTAQPGGQVMKPNGKGVENTRVPAPIKPSGETVPGVLRDAVTSGEKIPYASNPTIPTEKAARAAKLEKAASEKAAIQAAKEKQNADALAKIRSERAGLEKQTTFGETISAKNKAGGTERMNTRYSEPGDEGNDVSALREMILGESKGGPTVLRPEPKPGPVQSPKAPAPAPEPPPTATLLGEQEGIGPLYNVQGGPSDASTVSAETLGKLGIQVPEAAPESALAQFFKTRQGAAGKNYRLAKEAEKAGEIPTSQHAREALLREQKPKVVVESPGETIPEGVDPNWIQKETNTVDELTRLQKLANGESGGIDPVLAARLGLGAGGALAGAVADPDHPVEGAVVGGGLGAIAPSALQALGPRVANQGGGNFLDALKAVGRRIPQVQRFNMLSSLQGLPANMWVGPYGSAIMGSLEEGLSGNPAGFEALKNLGPVQFAKEWKDSLGEASKLIGRAEGTSLASGKGNVLDEFLAIPGTGMTAGDEAARTAMTSGGISPEKARQFTLTSEPEAQWAHNIANFTRKSPFLQSIMPFSRTPINIVEQGLRRIPGLGFAFQAARETPDSLRQQLVQQGLGTAAGGVGYAVGSNLDPQDKSFLGPRNVARYGSNFAGPYSLPFSIGMAAGVANAKGKDPLQGALQEGAGAIPLPQVELLTDRGKSLIDLLNVAKGDKDIESLSKPRGVVPALYDELQGFFDSGLGTPGGPQAPTPNPVAPVGPRSPIRLTRGQ